MSRAGRAGAAVLAAVLSAAAPASAVTAGDAIARAARYLVSRQQPSGAFSFEDAPADAVAETVASLVVAGVGGEPVERALSYVGARGPARARERGGAAGRIVLGLVAAGRDPRSFGGFDYLAQLESFYDPVTGAYDSGLYADALAALRVLAAGRPLPAQAVTRMRAGQCASGGFSNDEPCIEADLDTTALVLNTLVLAGATQDDDARARAVRFLEAARNDDGGFGFRARDGDTNANSTGLVLSALASIGEPPGAAPWSRDGRDPVRALLALQLSSGAFRHVADDDRANDYATVQAIPGLAGTAYPVRAPTAPAVTRPDPPAASRAAQAAGDARTSRRPAVPSPPVVGAPGATNRAGLVIDLGAGDTREFCIPFREPTISGIELLLRSRLPVVTQDFGGGNLLVCAIAGVGRRFPTESCAPPCPAGGACTFWGYYRIASPAVGWTFSERGAGGTQVRHGEVDAWRWAPQDIQGSDAPPATTLDQVCARADGGAGAVAAVHPSPRSQPFGLIAFGSLLAALGGWGARLARARRRMDRS